MMHRFIWRYTKEKKSKSNTYQQRKISCNKTTTQYINPDDNIPDEINIFKQEFRDTKSYLESEIQKLRIDMDQQKEGVRRKSTKLTKDMEEKDKIFLDMKNYKIPNGEQSQMSIL